MAESKARPTRSRPGKTTVVETPDETPATPEAVPAAEKPKRAARKTTPAKRGAAGKLPVYYEDTDALTLQGLGSFKGDKPAEALESYFNALEPEDQAQALESATYAVETPKGLVRLTLAQKLDIQPR